ETACDAGTIHGRELTDTSQEGTPSQVSRNRVGGWPALAVWPSRSGKPFIDRTPSDVHDETSCAEAGTPRTNVIHPSFQIGGLNVGQRNTDVENCGKLFGRDQLQIFA